MNSDILALKEKLDKIKNLGWIECKNKNKSVFVNMNNHTLIHLKSVSIL